MRIGLGDSDVVDEGERFGAHTDEVVHVHRYAVDAHSLQAPHLTGQLELGADSIGGQRQPRISEFDDPSEAPRERHGSALLSWSPDRGSQSTNQALNGTTLGIDVNTAGCVVHRLASHTPPGGLHPIILTIH